MPNPLFSDREVRFVLHEVERVAELCQLPGLSAHSADTIDMYVDACARVAREQLYPAYVAMDREPPRFEGGKVYVHPRMRAIFPRLVELGIIAATRPEEVGGQALPVLVSTLAHNYLMAANLSATGFLGLTSGAARLIESFGGEREKRLFMDRMYRGEWTGTMALTEPQAGSALADVATKATPIGDGIYKIRGSKVFISGGDQDFSENIVHLTLARIDGAPPGVKGISLFAVPKRRPEGDGLVNNDVTITGVFHKLGWKGLPSVALSFGESEDCRGWLIGAPHQGLAYMFQMMNEARIMVGANGVSTAMVAYHEAVEYAKTRLQGRKPSAKDPNAPPIPILEHADVRRMLLKHRAIAEGGLLILAYAAHLADRAEHETSAPAKLKAKQLLDIITPIVKTFPAERGFEANALAVQVHGGYGYTSEYMPESWLRDQKLNTLHEGTTGIHSLDLVGRKLASDGGSGGRLLLGELQAMCKEARAAGVGEAEVAAVERALALTAATVGATLKRGMEQGPDAMLLHSASLLELVSTVLVAGRWLVAMGAAERGKKAGDPGSFYAAKLLTGRYWIQSELPRIEALARECGRANAEFVEMPDEAW
ncbi:MAG: acyl-CoA dehydrogenase [Myxococcota bacterium]